MNPLAALPAAAGTACLALAAATLWRGSATLSQRAFSVGMIGLAVEQGLLARGVVVGPTGELLHWLRLRLAATSLLPGAWILFAASFARARAGESLRRWRPILVLAFVGPPLCAALFAQTLARHLEPSDGERWVLFLGRAGHALHVLMLLAAAVILANLERTLRAAVGTMRWRIKFSVLGVGAIFAVRVYTSSQALLYDVETSASLLLDSTAVLVGALLVALSLARTRLAELDIYVSERALSGTLSVLLIAVYLLAVTLLAQASTWLGSRSALPLASLFVFLALLALTVVLLSDELRSRAGRLASRYLRRPRHDYRQIWLEFTSRTSAAVEVRPLGDAVAGMLSDVLKVPAVTLWLTSGEGDEALFGGSTVLGEPEAATLLDRRAGIGAIAARLADDRTPFEVSKLARTGEAAGEVERFRALTEARTAHPLESGGELLGFVTLGSRLPEGPFAPEEIELLATLLGQASASLARLRLSERLLRAREMEAFQSLSAFFVHDLKNLASKLSLTLQNAPAHWDDPAFRSDMLEAMRRSVAKIETMCGRLSPLSRGLELAREPVAVGSLAERAARDLAAEAGLSLSVAVEADPEIAADAEQLRKVVTNLVLNAVEASEPGSEVRVRVEASSSWATIAVSDSGCGMSPDYVRRYLFQPFRTTKPRGLGIGLYHCREIVEAHGGRIDVESAPGEGSTFRVRLPLG